MFSNITGLIKYITENHSVKKIHLSQGGEIPLFHLFSSKFPAVGRHLARSYSYETGLVALCTARTLAPPFHWQAVRAPVSAVTGIGEGHGEVVGLFEAVIIKSGGPCTFPVIL